MKTVHERRVAIAESFDGKIKKGPDIAMPLRDNQANQKQIMEDDDEAAIRWVEKEHDPSYLKIQAISQNSLVKDTSRSRETAEIHPMVSKHEDRRQVVGRFHIRRFTRRGYWIDWLHSSPGYGRK
ncbi:hypothetical protein [Hydrogenispora ethanolica]|uniref:hypothetical protein n=1 Tax=Hydrogenispora ethanolica TaxID=1082276 RepID=UPI001404C298|nr:hypothetical protein [Hydrogenispora ethanolica]